MLLHIQPSASSVMQPSSSCCRMTCFIAGCQTARQQAAVSHPAGASPAPLSGRRPGSPAALRCRSIARQPAAPVTAVREHLVSPIGNKGSRFAIVVSRFNELVTRALLAGAVETFQRYGVPERNLEVVWVPGAYEIPVVASAMARSGHFDCVVAIGTVVRGETTHYDAVAGGAATGVLDVSRTTGVPTIFGVLTTETMEQAQDRAGGKAGNKGSEAALTALEMTNLLSQLRADGLASPAWGVETADG